MKTTFIFSHFFILSAYVYKLFQNRHYQDAVFRKLVTSTILLDMDADFLDELDRKDPPSCKPVLDSPRINIG